MAERMASLDPFDFDTYLTQRLSEVFGPDLGGFLPTLGALTGEGRGRAQPVTVHPERWIESVGGRAPWIDVETAEQNVTETEPYHPSRREIRRAFRQYISIDICEVEDGDGYLVEADLPGVSKEDISIHVDHNNVLTIDAKPPLTMAQVCDIIPHKEKQLEPSSEAKAPETPRPTRTQDLPTPKESPTALEKASQPAEKPEERQTSERQVLEHHHVVGSGNPRKFMPSERNKGRLHRSIRLPKHADAEDVSTCLVNGVLCLYFKKLPETHSAKRIELR